MKDPNTWEASSEHKSSPSSPSSQPSFTLLSTTTCWQLNYPVCFSKSLNSGIQAMQAPSRWWARTSHKALCRGRGGEGTRVVWRAFYCLHLHFGFRGRAVWCVCVCVCVCVFVCVCMFVCVCDKEQAELFIGYNFLWGSSLRFMVKL
jgi:hypothetical protein